MSTMELSLGIAAVAFVVAVVALLLALRMFGHGAGTVETAARGAAPPNRRIRPVNTQRPNSVHAPAQSRFRPAVTAAGAPPRVTTRRATIRAHSAQGLGGRMAGHVMTNPNALCTVCGDVLSGCGGDH